MQLASEDVINLGALHAERLANRANEVDIAGNKGEALASGERLKAVR